MGEIKLLITEAEIAARVRELGRRVEEDYRDKNPVIVGILNGAFIFMADLLRTLTIRHRVEFIRASSYGSGTQSSGEVKISADVACDLAGRNVLIVEDIIDTGLTLERIIELFLKRGAKSVAVICLLLKPGKSRVKVAPGYFGFAIPDRFVVGYGLDRDGDYRNLPYVGHLDG